MQFNAQYVESDKDWICAATCGVVTKKYICVCVCVFCYLPVYLNHKLTGESSMFSFNILETAPQNIIITICTFICTKFVS